MNLIQSERAQRKDQGHHVQKPRTHKNHLEAHFYVPVRMCKKCLGCRNVRCFTSSFKNSFLHLLVFLRHSLVALGNNY